MNKTEFLKMALEKLTAASNYIDTLGGVSKGYRMDIERIKAALANEALERKAENARELGLDYEPLEAKDEPVAWRTFDGEGGYDYQTYENNENYANNWNKCNPNHKGWVEPLYTTPPQRTWVGLTDEEIDKAWRSVDYTVPWDQHRIDIARAIEAKLKEKNT
jgi:hypothetical protein